MSGRMAISSCAVVLSTQALIATINYVCRRTQQVKLMPGGKICLFDYYTTRVALLPELAKCFALRIGTNYVKRRYAEMVLAAESAIDRSEVIRLVCSFKAYNTLWSERVTAKCREKVGGQGLLSCNKLADLNSVAASLVVVEGDSMVLSQKVAREIMFQFSGRGVAATISALAKRKIALAATNLAISTQGLIALDVDNVVKSPAFQLRLLKLRLDTLVAGVVENLLLQGMIVGKASVAEAWAKKHLDNVVAINNAYVEYTALVQMQAAVARAKGDVPDRVLRTLCHLTSLFALSTIEQHLAWFGQHTSLSACLATAVSRQVRRLANGISADNAISLVSAFSHPTRVMSIPIANDCLPKGY